MPLPTLRRLVLAATGAVVAGAAAVIPGCASNPATGGHDIVLTSEAKEIEMGKRMHQQVMQEYARYDDEQLQAYVNELGQRIAAKSHRPNIQYTFTVLDSDEVNAFAIPGYVYVTRGIIVYLNSEAELVAVMGHEVGHITARHQVRQQTGSTATNVGASVIGILTRSGDLANVAGAAGTALVRGYGRDMELEADGLGAEYLNRLGYDPHAMIDVVRLLKNQELLEIQQAREEKREPHIYHGVFATHPDNDTRLKEVIAAAGKVDPHEVRPDNREVFLQHINGMPFGPSRAQGVIRGNRFYHADMGVTMAFPSGWTIQNLPDKVVGISPNKDAVLQVSTMAPPQGMSPKDFLTRALSGTRIDKTEAFESNGLQGYAAIAKEAPLPFGNKGPARYAVVYFNNLAYVFLGATRIGAALPESDPVIMSSVKTFRRLKDREFKLAEPDRIQVIKATADTRIETLAAKSPLPKYAAEKLRLLNDLYPDKEPTPGQLIKVVVE
jgi:predicted Zn-dependent protease